MHLLLTVKVDTNDGDYRTKTSVINDGEVDAITNLFTGLDKSLYGGRVWDVEDFNFEPMKKKYGNIFDDAELNLLCNLIPTCEHGYTRNIESVTLTPLAEIINIV